MQLRNPPWGLPLAFQSGDKYSIYKAARLKCVVTLEGQNILSLPKEEPNKRDDVKTDFLHGGTDAAVK